MLSTYFIIMGIVAGIITFAWALGQIVKVIKTFEEYDTYWEKFASILNLLGIITMGVAISLIVTIMEILNGFLDTDKEKIKMAQTFNCNKFQLLTKIVIPANISTFINSLKINIGLSLVGVITGEFLVSKAGLGYLIVYGGQVFKLDLVMTGGIILALVGTILYGSVGLLEKLLSKSHKFV